MMGGWGFLGGRGGLPTSFEEQYHCYSAAYADKSHLELGDKILLPPSAFDILARLQVDYPMLFQLQSPEKGTLTHCGVLEFTAEEGSCVIPFWMMQNLLIEEGAVLTVSNVSLPKANYVKFQAQHVDFLEISNPRAVLEHALRNFSCITKGDVICVPYNSKNYHFEIKEVRPQTAACIIETDCNVDFDAPVGYKDPDTSLHQSVSSAVPLANLPKQSAFASPELRSSVCPSPTPLDAGQDAGGVRIVDGKIVRSDDIAYPSTEHLASQKGATGVQQNAAIPVRAPTVDYWALTAGEGARLDGKMPAVLRDKSGVEVDWKKMRADAAAKRAVEEAKNKTNLPTVGKTVRGEHVQIGESSDTPAIRKNKSRVGGKYSKLKGGAVFHGSSNQF